MAVNLLFKSTSVQLANSTGGAAGGPVFKVIAISCITELLAAQRMVNSESYRRQWQALNAGVVISDARLPDMPVVYINPIFEQMSGFSSGEVLGGNCRFLQREELNQDGLSAIRHAITNQTNGCAKLRNYRKTGRCLSTSCLYPPSKTKPAQLHTLWACSTFKRRQRRH